MMVTATWRRQHLLALSLTHFSTHQYVDHTHTQNDDDVDDVQLDTITLIDVTISYPPKYTHEMHTGSHTNALERRRHTSNSSSDTGRSRETPDQTAQGTCAPLSFRAAVSSLRYNAQQHIAFK